jgi:hypothetical protein
MKKASLAVVLLVCLGLLLPAVSTAQQAAPTGYTFVAEWDAPRDKWPEITAYGEKNWRPLLERLVADGTLTDFGIYETVVHQNEGETHGLWWSSASIAGIEKARLEAIKIPPAPGLAAAKHHDYFLRSLIWKGRPGNGTGGYLRVATSVVQPGKGAQWLALWRKYSQPLYDELAANGTFAAYGVQLEQVVTDDPGVRMVVAILPNAEAIDKAQAASNAVTEKRTQQERDAITAEFLQVTVPSASRTYLARINFYSMK